MSVLDVLQVSWFFAPAYVADMSPILARELFPRLTAPIDGGRTWRGERMLGSHKTWRGLVACVFAGILVWELQVALYEAGILRGLAPFDYTGRHVVPGLLLGFGAGFGDVAKSFFKRRVGIGPGERWLGFDQLDFFAGALLFGGLVYLPSPLSLAVVVPIVLVCEVSATAVFWWLGLKESWI